MTGSNKMIKREKDMLIHLYSCINSMTIYERHCTRKEINTINKLIKQELAAKININSYGIPTYRFTSTAKGNVLAKELIHNKLMKHHIKSFSH
jgi:hypothetical protein